MSEAVCGFCGKRGGWHMFGCPAFSDYGAPTNRLAIEESDDDVVIVIRSLPEVE